MWNLKKKKKGGTKERTYRTERVTHVENKFIIMAGQRWIGSLVLMYIHYCTK